MSCGSAYLLDNIRWRLETLATHTDADTTLKGFVWYDRDKLSGDVSSGMTRGFTLEWGGSSADGGVMDLAVQQFAHDVVLRVAYYRHGDWAALQRLILRDRFDIIKLLRNPDNWTGTAENAAAVTNIDSRFLARDEVTEAAHALYLVQRWRHSLIEAE